MSARAPGLSLRAYRALSPALAAAAHLAAPLESGWVNEVVRSELWRTLFNDYFFDELTRNPAAAAQLSEFSGFDLVTCMANLTVAEVNIRYTRDECVAEFGRDYCDSVSYDSPDWPRMRLLSYGGDPLALTTPGVTCQWRRRVCI